MFTTVDRYVIGRLLRTFLPAFLGLCCAFFIGGTFQLLKVEGLPFGQVLLALPWVVPFLLPYLIPLAYLLAVALVYGRMVADNEVLAFASLGVPPRALAWPAVLLASGLSACSLWTTASLMPHTHQRRKEAAAAVFQQLFSLGSGQHFSRSFSTQGFDIYVRRYGPEGLRGVVFHYQLPGGHPAHIVAERGRVLSEEGGERLRLQLYEVTMTIVVPARAGGPPQVVRLYNPTWDQPVDLGGRRRIKVDDFSSADLVHVIGEEDRLGALAAASGGYVAAGQGRNTRALEARLELAMRAAVGLAPLLLTLVGAPVALLFRARGGGALAPFAAALVGGVVAVYVPLLLGLSLAETLGRLEPIALALAPALAIGGAAYLRVERG